MRFFLIAFLFVFSIPAQSRQYPPTTDSYSCSIGAWNAKGSTDASCMDSLVAQLQGASGNNVWSWFQVGNHYGLRETYQDGGSRELGATVTPVRSCPQGGKPMLGNYGVWFCDAPACPAGSVEQPDASCQCQSEGFLWLPGNNTCVPPPESSCPDGHIEDEKGRCVMPNYCPYGQIKDANGVCKGCPSFGGLLLPGLSKPLSCVNGCLFNNCLSGDGGYSCEVSGSYCSPGDVDDTDNPGDGEGGDTGGSNPGGGGDTGGSNPGGGGDSGGSNPGGGGDTGGSNPGGGGDGNGGTGGNGSGGGNGNGAGDGGEEEGNCPAWLGWICGKAEVDDLTPPPSSQFDDAFFKGAFSALLSWSPPVGAGSCSPVTFVIFDKQYSLTVHCDFMNEYFVVLSSVMMAVWSLVAFRIVMSA